MHGGVHDSKRHMTSQDKEAGVYSESLSLQNPKFVPSLCYVCLGCGQLQDL